MRPFFAQLSHRIARPLGLTAATAALTSTAAMLYQDSTNTLPPQGSHDTPPPPTWQQMLATPATIARNRYREATEPVQVLTQEELHRLFEPWVPGKDQFLVFRAMDLEELRLNADPNIPFPELSKKMHAFFCHRQPDLTHAPALSGTLFPPVNGGHGPVVFGEGHARFSYGLTWLFDPKTAYIGGVNFGLYAWIPSQTPSTDLLPGEDTRQDMKRLPPEALAATLKRCEQSYAQAASRPARNEIVFRPPDYSSAVPTLHLDPYAAGVLGCLEVWPADYVGRRVHTFTELVEQCQQARGAPHPKFCVISHTRQILIPKPGMEQAAFKALQAGADVQRLRTRQHAGKMAGRPGR